MEKKSSVVISARTIDSIAIFAYYLKTERLMTKAELAKKISQDTGLEVSASMAAVDSFMNNVKASLKAGEIVTLSPTFHPGKIFKKVTPSRSA